MPSDRNSRRPKTGQPTLLIFVKAPVPGHVKTRLCPPLTPVEAAELYQAFAADTVAMARRLMRTKRMACRVAYDPHPAAPTPAWLDPTLPWDRQRGRQLGQRLIHAGASAFADGADPLVIIGSDTPDLPATRVLRAFDALRTHELVLGPSADGGYYLIGLQRPVPALFRGIDWSTERVLAQTLERARSLPLRVALLKPHRDLDAWSDVAVWRDNKRGRAPQTYRELRTLWSRYGSGSVLRGDAGMPTQREDLHRAEGPTRGPPRGRTQVAQDPLPAIDASCQRRVRMVG